jgi:hypothetical protein
MGKEGYVLLRNAWRVTPTALTRPTNRLKLSAIRDGGVEMGSYAYPFPATEKYAKIDL